MTRTANSSERRRRNRPAAWPALAGAARNTWARWRDAALDCELIELGTGTYSDSGRVIETLQPRAPEREGEEQFARAPAALLFDPLIPLRAKRIYLCIALYRGRDDLARVPNATVIRLTGYERRDVHGCCETWRRAAGS